MAWCQDPCTSFHPSPPFEVPHCRGCSALGHAWVTAPPASLAQRQESAEVSPFHLQDRCGQCGVVAPDVLCFMAILILNRLYADFSAGEIWEVLIHTTYGWDSTTLPQNVSEETVGLAPSDNPLQISPPLTPCAEVWGMPDASLGDGEAGWMQDNPPI